MREGSLQLPVAARRALLATCLTCTLWLIVQNSILLTVLPWERIVGATLRATPLLKLGVGVAVTVTLVVVAFGLGWLAAGWIRGSVTQGRKVS